MSNQFATCTILAKETLAILKNMTTFAKNVNRDWEDEFTSNQARGYSPGATINIKKPPRFGYRAGRIAAPQAIVESTIPLTLSQGGGDLNVTSFDRTLSIQQWEQKLTAMTTTIANEIDRQGLVLAHQATYNALGTPGTPPNTQALALDATLQINQRLDEEAAPRDRNRALIMGPALNRYLVGGFAGLFNSSTQLDKQYQKGMMVDALGLSYAMDQNVDTHINGTAVVGTNTANGANQQGSSITVTALNGTITKGSKITFAGVFLVNPQSRQSTGNLAQFTVTADTAAGATTLPIAPAIVNSGNFQNVSNSPSTNATITIFGSASGSYSTNVAFHKDAFTLAMVPMYAPPSGKGVVDCHQETSDGFTMKVTEFYDGINDNYIIRFDVLFGWAAPYPELACLYGL